MILIVMLALDDTDSDYDPLWYRWWCEELYSVQDCDLDIYYYLASLRAVGCWMLPCILWSWALPHRIAWLQSSISIVSHHQSYFFIIPRNAAWGRVGDANKLIKKKIRKKSDCAGPTRSKSNSTHNISKDLYPPCLSSNPTPFPGTLEPPTSTNATRFINPCQYI